MIIHHYSLIMPVDPVVFETLTVIRNKYTKTVIAAIEYQNVLPCKKT